MSRLEELRQIVADAFKTADTKESIEQLATINNKIDEVNQEQASLESKNAELIKSYKDLVQHTSFKDDNVPTDEVGTKEMPSLEEALASFMEKQNK